jgi:hypothetical protein
MAACRYSNVFTAKAFVPVCLMTLFCAAYTVAADSNLRDTVVNADGSTSSHPDTVISQSANQRPFDPPLDCGLYMALSSIPNAGWGMYNGATPIADGQRIVGTASGEPVIQVEDFSVNRRLRAYYHYQLLEKEEREKKRQELWANGEDGDDLDESVALLPPPPTAEQGNDWWLMGNYYWDSAVSYGAHEADTVQSVIPGLGMLVNSHPGLVNARIRPPTSVAPPLHDPTGRILIPYNQSHFSKPNPTPPFYFHRARDPGAGASTMYHDLHFVADTKPFQARIKDGSSASDSVIPPFAELFVRYGDDWFIERRVEMGHIPVSSHFQFADQVSEKLWSLVSQFNSTSSSNASRTLGDELLELVNMMVTNETDVPPYLGESPAQEEAQRLLGALPKTAED